MMRRVAFVACLVAATSCDQAKNPPAAKNSAAAFSFSPGPTTSSAKLWDDDIGAVLATPSIDGGAPLFFSRDSTSRADIDVDLLNHDDHPLHGRLHPADAEHACAARRHARVTMADGTPAPSSWSLALAPGLATPIGIDGVGDLLPRDSAALVARIARLVSAIPEDSLTAQFRGLPVVVRDAWRFRLADSTSVVVAIAMRSLNVESNPRAQSITIVAEPDPTSGSDAWRNVFSESESGPEDRVEGADLLAVFQLRGARAALALVHEAASGLQLEIVERTAPGVWKIRWSSASLSCAQP